MAAKLPSTMKAWQYSSTAGGLENNLSLNPSASLSPALRADEALIQVISASLNPADYKVPEMGAVAKAVIGSPATPGMDFSGRIVLTGPMMTNFTSGQLVYGSLGRPMKLGTLGEYIAASEDSIAALPEGLDPDLAATVGIAGQTAYQSIAPYVSSGDKVFINGGSGGCGMFAIQIAKQLGCHVTTTCSSRNIDFCTELGADEVINYTKDHVIQTLKDKGQVFSLVVDHIGTPDDLYCACDAFLLPGKPFVQVGASKFFTFANRLVRPSFFGGGKRKYVILMFKNTNSDLVQVGKWIQEGKVKVTLDSVFEFEDAVKAFEKLRSGRACGKIVVHVSEKP